MPPKRQLVRAARAAAAPPRRARRRPARRPAAATRSPRRGRRRRSRVRAPRRSSRSACRRTSATSLSTQKPWAKPTGTYSSRMLSSSSSTRLPLPVRRRAPAQVDGHVEDPPAGAAHELGDAGADLEVHAAQHPAAGARVVVLDEAIAGGYPQRSWAVLAVGLHEEAALVAVDGGLDHDEAGEAKRHGAHGEAACQPGAFAYIRRAMGAATSAVGSEWIAGPRRPELRPRVAARVAGRPRRGGRGPGAASLRGRAERAARIAGERERRRWTQQPRRAARAALTLRRRRAVAAAHRPRRAGKPRLAAGGIEFNLSHSRRPRCSRSRRRSRWASTSRYRASAAAISSRSPVAPSAPSEARRLAELAGEPSRRPSSCGQWVRREARLKCLGTGLGAGSRGQAAPTRGSASSRSPGGVRRGDRVRPRGRATSPAGTAARTPRRS